jgi:hypothetical protein
MLFLVTGWFVSPSRGAPRWNVGRQARRERQHGLAAGRRFTRKASRDRGHVLS